MRLSPLVVALLCGAKVAGAEPQVTLPGFIPPISDHYVAEAATGEVSAFAWRGFQGDTTRAGISAGSSRLGVVRTGPFDIAGGQGTRFRIFGSHGVALSLTYGSVVSVRLGPVEPMVSIGFALATLDDIRGHASFELFSPTVGAGVALRVSQRMTVGALASSEYLWRWFGTDYRIASATLLFRIEASRAYGEL